MAALHVNDQNFEQEVLQSSVPVLVDFWAPWCGPCRAMGPVIDELSTELEGNVKVVKVNVDDAGETAIRYGIRSIPTLSVFENGQVVNTISGAVPKSTLLKALQVQAK